MKSLDLANLCRKDIINMTSAGNSAHVGSCLSCIDILSVLYFDILNIDPNNPLKKDRDIFIMSKGHAGAALYSVLARRGFFNVEDLLQHYQNGSNFSGHVNSHLIKGIEVSTGSLGNGLGLACGYAYNNKLINSRNKVYTLISDGEMNEGSTWEAILFAAHHELNNLTCILDANGLQSIKSTTDTLNVEPLKDKLEQFNWDTIEISGHDHEILTSSLKSETMVKPRFIIARTIKGKGISFMENKALWHYRNAKGAELINALEELN
tara:strand:+ start:26921 stop:27715 length:795 start_codon:yes stop_codon:yes gene_type:complete